ncbi:MAG: alpha-galactosidase [Lachnospiraceae bacterium]|nr:alpha-galactosidase [Lachnospiraceae bacterium]
MKNALYELIETVLLPGDGIAVGTNRTGSLTLSGFEKTEDGNGFTLRYVGERKHDFDEFTVRAEIGEDFALLSLRAVLHYWNGELCDFLPRGAVTLPVKDTENQGMTASFREKPWWMYPSFPKNFSGLRDRTQSLFMKKGKNHYHFLPLTGDDFRCEFMPGSLSVSTDTAGVRVLTGPFLAVASADSPYAAVEKSYAGARAAGAIRVPLKKERSVPELFDSFGYCTWNSFYTGVTSEKIYEKLEEFKAKGVPVKWMIIDDGWMQTKDSRLCSFEADPVKFPEGLKETVRRINSYGVKVGVWHAFLGYWEGVCPGSPLFEAQKENLDHTPSDRWVPSLDEERGFKFWDAWHSYLASCGVEFLKVDNQSSTSGALAGMMPTAVACRHAHNAFERSVMKNFGGRLINCMGMEMENVLARPFTAVTRNSDDFFPNNERGFPIHLIQNVYSALWEDQMYCCDFDMWWTTHPSAVESGVLRAISGSPVYVSDETGKTDPARIRPICGADGRLNRLDGAALPTAECVYSDCMAEGRPLTVFNRKGDAFAVAAFNVTGKTSSGSFALKDIPGTEDCEYYACEYFSRSVLRCGRESVIPVTVEKDETKVYSFFPIRRKNGKEFTAPGDPTRYVSIGTGETPVGDEYYHVIKK